MKQLILDYTPYCTRAALVENGELIDFSVERTNAMGLVGNIYKGKVENVLEGMKAAFVNIGLERNGFLFVGDSRVDKTRIQSVMPKRQKQISPGDVIMCQVVKDQFGTKGARLATDITLPGYYLVLLPDSSFIGVSRKIEDDERREYLEQLVTSICPDGMGFIIRSAADSATDRDIVVEASLLLALWEKIKNDYVSAPEKSMVFEEMTLFERALRDTFNEDIDRVIVNDAGVASALEGRVGKARIELYTGERGIMAHFGISTQINHLCDRRVDIPGGAYIVIDKTEALTVIDVNTGKFVGSRDLEDTVFRTNLAAADTIAKQLRIRNISGIIVIDFIDMEIKEHRDAVLQRLETALKPDHLRTATIGMTPLGLVELTRKKTRLGLDDFMLRPCKECGSGFEISDIQLCFMLRDELVDFFIAHHLKTLFVGLNPAVYNMVFESNIFERSLQNAWKDKCIWLYADDEIKRDRFIFHGSAPENLPMSLKRLKSQESEE